MWIFKRELEFLKGVLGSSGQNSFSFEWKRDLVKMIRIVAFKEEIEVSLPFVNHSESLSVVGKRINLLVCTIWS